MTVEVIISDWSTRAYPTPRVVPGKEDNILVTIPPEDNVHYEWCLENAITGTWRINFFYPYYDIILDEEDASAFVLKFGNIVYE